MERFEEIRKVKEVQEHLRGLLAYLEVSDEPDTNVVDTIKELIARRLDV